MQRCPKCNRVYTEGIFTFCLDDGALLSAPDNQGETETVVISKTPLTEASPNALTGPVAQKSNKLFWIAGVVAVLIFGTVLILYFQNDALKFFSGSSDKTKITENLSPEEAIKKGIAATVNGEPIMLNEVERIRKQSLTGETENKPASEIKTTRLQVLDLLIEQEVLFQSAKKEGLLPSEDEITTYINTLKQQMTQEEFQRSLKDAGLTDTDFRESARKEIAFTKLHQNITVKVGQPTDSDVEAYFKSTNQDDKITLDTPGVRQDIVQKLVEQRKQALVTEFVEKAKREAKIVNYLAASGVN